MRTDNIKCKFLLLCLAALLVVCFMPVNSAYGASSDKNKLKSVQKQKNNVRSDIQKLDKQRRKEEKKINKLKAKISDKQDDIKKSQKDLDQTKKKIEKRQDGLEKRVRAMYKNGSVGYIDIILNSKNISELVTNVEMVQKIYKNDQSFLTVLKHDRSEIEAKQAKLKAEQERLSVEKEKMAENQREIDVVTAKLKDKYKILSKQEESLRASIIAAQKAAKRRAAAAAKRGRRSNYSVAASRNYSGGSFHWPTVGGVISSQYLEQRSYERHPGIDIAVPTGTPIYAAAGGVVVTAGTYGGYGYAVVISHGGNLTTVYGHNSGLLVHVGQRVGRGQQIARAGSTGWSTGPHCHFEVRKGADQHTVSPWLYLKK